MEMGTQETVGQAHSHAEIPSSCTTGTHRVLALYKFTPVPPSELVELSRSIEEYLRGRQTTGYIILAAEGINGTVCYPHPHHEEEEDEDEILNFFSRLKYFSGMRTRVSLSPKNVFHRLKMKIKDEIVTLGNADTDPLDTVGTYIPPEEWDAVLEDPDVLVIDTRNDYEVTVGTFENAVNPKTANFTEFPEWMERYSEDASLRKPTAVAMFCTGGIRCEKATSYVLARKLFGDDVPVHHLEGGILAYLSHKQRVADSDSKFRGECYVFDQRISVTDGLQPGTYEKCHGCRMPLSGEDRGSEWYEYGVSCHYCFQTLEDGSRKRRRDRQRQIEIACERGDVHIHDPKYILPKNKNIT